MVLQLVTTSYRDVRESTERLSFLASTSLSLPSASAHALLSCLVDAANACCNTCNALAAPAVSLALEATLWTYRDPLCDSLLTRRYDLRKPANSCLAWVSTAVPMLASNTGRRMQIVSGSIPHTALSIVWLWSCTLNVGHGFIDAAVNDVVVGSLASGTAGALVGCLARTLSTCCCSCCCFPCR